MSTKRPMHTPNGSAQTPKFYTKEEFLEYRRRVLLAKEARRRKQAQKRKRVIIAASAVLLSVFLIVMVIITIANRGNPSMSDTDTAGQTVYTEGSDTKYITTEAEMTEELTTPEPETEPLYEGENMVLATPIVPKMTENTLTLTSEIATPHMILIDLQNAEVIAQKAADTGIYPASMTKLMTVLVAYEQNKDLDKTFRITQSMIDPLYLDGLALAGFANGEEVTLHDLLYASALPSAAEASMALALSTAGSEEAFVGLMNDRATTLGMTQTHFENCTGTHHADHVSTVGDIAVLLAYILNDPFLSEMISTYQYTTAPTSAHPEGLLLTSTVFSYMAGDESETCTVIGGKTGYTIPAGRCLATAAKRNDTGAIYICVIAGGEKRWDPVYDTIKLYKEYTAP